LSNGGYTDLKMVGQYSALKKREGKRNGLKRNQCKKERKKNKKNQQVRSREKPVETSVGDMARGG